MSKINVDLRWYGIQIKSLQNVDYEGKESGIIIIRGLNERRANNGSGYTVQSYKGANLPVKSLLAKGLPAKNLPAKTVPTKTVSTKTVPAEKQDAENKGPRRNLNLGSSSFRN